MNITNEDFELMQKCTTTILYDDTLYSDVELYMYMAEEQCERYEACNFVNVQICAYAYLCLTKVTIHIGQKEDEVIEIRLEHNVSNRLVDNVKKFVFDACKFFSENTLNNTNITYFQRKFLVKTKILFNLPVLYNICKKVGLF
jgi:hypothetical protein